MTMTGLIGQGRENDWFIWAGNLFHQVPNFRRFFPLKKKDSVQGRNELNTGLEEH
jgi:hypothetical protein